MNGQKFLHRDEKPIPTDLFEKQERIWWLRGHRVWQYDFSGRGHGVNGYDRLVEIEPAYVNPLTDAIDDDESLNTSFQVWIEAGPMFDMSTDPSWEPPPGGWLPENKWIRTHDYDLNVGAADLETALLYLATRVEVFYNEDGTNKGIERCPLEWVEGSDDYVSTCEGTEDDFCKKCGFALQ